VRRYNVGLVGGKLQLAVLEKRNGAWIAHHEDPGETEGQVEYLEEYISEFREKQKPDVAAQASSVDLNKEIPSESVQPVAPQATPANSAAAPAATTVPTASGERSAKLNRARVGEVQLQYTLRKQSDDFFSGQRSR
jgi:hypothetical protein